MQHSQGPWCGDWNPPHQRPCAFMIGVYHMDYMILGNSTIITSDGTHVLNDEQRAAYDRYIELFNRNTPPGCGNSLSIATEEECAARDAFLETLKTSEQKFIDRVQAWALDYWRELGQDLEITTCEETIPETVCWEWYAEDLAGGDRLFEVAGCDEYGRRWHNCWLAWRASANSFDVLQSYCNTPPRW